MGDEYLACLREVSRDAKYMLVEPNKHYAHVVCHYLISLQSITFARLENGNPVNLHVYHGECGHCGQRYYATDHELPKEIANDAAAI